MIKKIGSILSLEFIRHWVVESSRKRMLQLDFLRGVAILLVLGRHYAVSPARGGVFEYIALRWAHIGWTGVDLFFVLSGFLIGGLLFSEFKKRGSIDIKRFIIRRGFKIWPAYLIFVFYLLLRLTVKNWPNNPMEGLISLWPNFLHIQNYFGTPRVHTWSLAVEEHFYLTLPLVLYFLLKERKNKILNFHHLPVLLLICIVVSSVMRFFYNYGRASGTLEGEFYQTHLRSDGLALGVLIAYLYYFKPECLDFIKQRKRVMFMLGLLLISPMAYMGLETHALVSGLGLSLLYLGYGLILIVIVFSQINVGFLGKLMGGFVGRMIAFIGFFSYPIYLWHADLGKYPMQAVAKLHLWETLPAELSWIALTGGYLLLAITSGMILSYLIEKPTLAIRDTLFPGHSKAMENR
ncbi:MAG: acyltransferase [Candidatus Omnitrophica bacterium]|nr:acyltransferase [Candidatus Omnitrophota bacterium]